MAKFISKTLLTLALFASPGFSSTPNNKTAKTLSHDAALQALNDLAQITQMDVDTSLTDIVDRYYQLPKTEGLAQTAVEALFDEQGLAGWTAAVEDFTSLADVIYADYPASQKKALDQRYKADQAALKTFEGLINSYVAKVHPGYRFLEATKLQAKAKGRGVKIAVFDVFDAEILASQSKSHGKAVIDQPLTFGNPVELNHGNTVIDIILTLAPEAEIIPVQADAQSYGAALEAILARDDIDVVNMSRAFADAADHVHLEPRFKQALTAIVQTKVVVKALGNTGTDLDGALTDIRVKKNLGPVNNLAGYDLPLIKDAYAENAADDLLLFAENLSLFADSIALTATIPGADAAVAARTLGVPAEGIWSEASQSYESGSSFAAPQLTALIALLTEAAKAKDATLSPVQARGAALRALKASASLGSQTVAEWGLGLPNGDAALLKL